MKHLIEKKINSEEIFNGVLLHVYKDQVLLPNGNESSREYIKHPGAVAILAFTDNNKIILEKQFRYPMNEVIIEIPAGKIDPGEDLLECAKRELLEETGYLSDKWEYLIPLYPCIGYSNEVIHIYVAKDLKLTKDNKDEDEFLDIFLVDINEAYEMIKKGLIKDAKTIIALLFYKNFYQNS